MKTQQDDLYAAEASITHLGRRFRSLEEVQAFLDALREEPWYEAQYGALVKRVEVYAIAGSRSMARYEAGSAAGLMQLTKAGLNQRTVCHELAHIFARAVHNSQSHDPYFARIYLENVFHIMGADAFAELLRAFNDYGIVHDPRGDN